MIIKHWRCLNCGSTEPPDVGFVDTDAYDVWCEACGTAHRVYLTPPVAREIVVITLDDKDIESTRVKIDASNEIIRDLRSDDMAVRALCQPYTDAHGERSGVLPQLEDVVAETIKKLGGGV